MVDYTPAGDIQQSVYTLLATNTAFDTSPAQYAALLQQGLADLKYILAALGGTTLIPESLTASSTVAANLTAHLNDQYENLVDNLGLVSSAISDAIGYGIIGQDGAPSGSLTDPTASYPDFFGSIMGSSNIYVSQAANQLCAMLAHATAILCGTMIATMIATNNQSILTALGPLNNLTALTAALEPITATSLASLSTALTSVGSLLATTQDPELAALEQVTTILSAFGHT